MKIENEESRSWEKHYTERCLRHDSGVGGAKELRIINYELRSISLSYANSETKGRLRSKRNLPYLTILNYELSITNYGL